MTYHARVDDEGKLEISPEALASIGLTPGDVVTIDQEGGRLVVEGQDLDGAVTRLRIAMRGYTVDQFLADRRADWGE